MPMNANIFNHRDFETYYHLQGEWLDGFGSDYQKISKSVGRLEAISIFDQAELCVHPINKYFEQNEPAFLNGEKVKEKR